MLAKSERLAREELEALHVVQRSRLSKLGSMSRSTLS